MKKICFLIYLISAMLWASPSLERGKKYFYQYCSGCHSLQYAKHESVFYTNLQASDARRWFGQVPPDLSLITLEYSKKWLTQYLTGFYPDHHARFGVNNQLMPNVVMPHVLSSKIDLGLKNKSDKIKIRNIAIDISEYLAEVAEPEYRTRLFLGVVVLVFSMMIVIMFVVLNKLYKN
jgi:ubiquinol-cytochrome c reductase cytochrome c1 subunit